jgi:hypothetical protein
MLRLRWLRLFVIFDRDIPPGAGRHRPQRSIPIEIRRGHPELPQMVSGGT